MASKNGLEELNPIEKRDILDRVRENFRVADSEYAKGFRRLKLLDAVDRGKLWESLGAKFPPYQILPDTNFVTYIKQNLTASVYSVTKGASILATSEEDVEPIENLNASLDYIWDSANIGQFQMEAGENAALFNIGITEVGWDASKITQGADGTRHTGNVVLKNIHPLKFMRDPFADSLFNAAYCMTWDELHENTIKLDPNYREPFTAWLAEKEANNTVMVSETVLRLDIDKPDPARAKGYYRVFRHYFRDMVQKGDKWEPCISRVDTVNNDCIVFYQKEIKPVQYPFVECYCNLPGGDLIGHSEPDKILLNATAYNILASLLVTSEYRNQRPPKFVNSMSGLNIATFTKWGNDPDHTFIVQGDASKAVHYHEFPQPSQQAPALEAQLANDIQRVTGVDDRYTGRDTGSVITTGGMEDMLGRVTLIDTPKIKNYENYSKNLTKLVLGNLIEFGMKRSYVRKNLQTGDYESYEVDFSDLQSPAFLSYSINISSELPKNKQRNASVANMLMEKQMQYGVNGDGPELITPEEWLMLQDLPNKEYMLRRMNIQRLKDKKQEVAEAVYNYGALLASGMEPDVALDATAQNMVDLGAGNDPTTPIPSMEELGLLQDANAMSDPALDYLDPSLAGGADLSMMAEPGLESMLGGGYSPMESIPDLSMIESEATMMDPTQLLGGLV